MKCNLSKASPSLGQLSGKALQSRINTCIDFTVKVSPSGANADRLSRPNLKSYTLKLNICPLVTLARTKADY